jgi:hypothetical protein
VHTVMGRVKSRHGRGGWGHSEGICQEPGIESKCERHKTQRSVGQEKKQLTKCQETRKRTKKDQLLQFTLFFGQKLGFWPELQTLPKSLQALTFGPQIELDLRSNVYMGFTMSISTHLTLFSSWQKQLFLGITTGITVLRGKYPAWVSIEEKDWHDYCVD